MQQNNSQIIIYQTESGEIKLEVTFKDETVWLNQMQMAELFRKSKKTIDEDDLVTEKTKEHYTLGEWEKTWMSKMNNNCVFISALNKENIDELKEKVFEEVKKIHITRFPYNDFLYQEYEEE